MAHVAPRIVEPDERARVALALLGLLDAAERARARRASSAGHAAAAEVVFEQREVRRDLAREVRLRPAGRTRLRAVAERAEPRHRSRLVEQQLVDEAGEAAPAFGLTLERPGAGAA